MALAPKFLFTMKLQSSKKLVEGNLTLTYEDQTTHKPVILTVPASSGAPGHQTLEKVWTVGKGPIPPSSAMLGDYTVVLAWYPPGNKAAIGARFYPIKPDPIISNNRGHKRTEIGLHLDNNYKYSPGSAGCVVGLPNRHPGWTELLAALDYLKAQGVGAIPLTVQYT